MFEVRPQSVEAHQIDAARFATPDHFKLSEVGGAYGVFQNAAHAKAIKVVVTR